MKNVFLLITNSGLLTFFATGILAMCTSSLALSESVSNAQLKTLEFGSQIRSREARAAEYDKAVGISSHSQVEFSIEGGPVFRAGQIQLTGYLTNSGVSKQTIYLAGQETTLSLEPQLTKGITLRKDPTAHPHSPSLFVLEVPARTRVKFIGGTDLAQLQYQGSPTIKIKWTFQFWTAPKPSGEVSFQLPSSQEAKLPPFQIDIQKFSSAPLEAGEFGPIAKITATLRNVSSEPQIYCHQPQINLVWSLLDNDGKQVDSSNTVVIDEHQPPLTEADCKVLAPNQTFDLETATLSQAKEGFELQTLDCRFNRLSQGSYRVLLSAQNAATLAGTDAKLVKALIENSHAPAPVQKVETTRPLTIP